MRIERVDPHKYLSIVPPIESIEGQLITLKPLGGLRDQLSAEVIITRLEGSMLIKHVSTRFLQMIPPLARSGNLSLMKSWSLNFFKGPER